MKNYYSAGEVTALLDQVITDLANLDLELDAEKLWNIASNEVKYQEDINGTVVGMNLLNNAAERTYIKNVKDISDTTSVSSKGYIDTQRDAVSGALSSHINDVSGALTSQIDEVDTYAQASSGTLNSYIVSISGELHTRIDNLGTEVDDISGVLNTKIDDVSGALYDQISGITHDATAIQGTPVGTSIPTSGQVIGYNGSEYAPVDQTGGGGGGSGAAKYTEFIDYDDWTGSSGEFTKNINHSLEADPYYACKLVAYQSGVTEMDEVQPSRVSPTDADNITIEMPTSGQTYVVVIS